MSFWRSPEASLPLFFIQNHPHVSCRNRENSPIFQWQRSTFSAPQIGFSMIRRRLPPGLLMLNERRSREEAMRFYADAERSTSFVLQRANFQTRSLRAFGSAEIKRRASLRQSHSEAALETRRRRLSALLKSDDDAHLAELQSVSDTTTTRRHRLIDSLKTLQAARQSEHDEYVRDCVAQGWRDACDPLRVEVSRAFEQQVIVERDAQLTALDRARAEGDAGEAADISQVR
jgi:hypothetical protein